MRCLLGMALVIALVACGSDDGGGGGGMCAASASGGDPACSECSERACCAEMTACASDPLCNGCLGSRSGASCENVGNFNAYVSCLSIQCNAECGFASGAGMGGSAAGSAGGTNAGVGGTAGTAGTSGTGGAGAGGMSGSGGTTMAPMKRPAGMSAPTPTGTEQPGMPEDTVLSDFEQRCFDLVTVAALVPETLYLSDLSDGAVCVSELNAGDIESQCGSFDNATWIVDSATCLVTVFFADCGPEITGVSYFGYGFGIANGFIWAEALAYDAAFGLVCSWDPVGGDFCDDLNTNGVCDDEEPDSCQYALDGTCDEPNLCAVGTDTTDCLLGDDSCQYAFDGECDEPAFCPVGTDTTDCAGL